MLLSAYCLSYGNWTVIPGHWEKVFGDMRELGFDAVDLSFSESEAMYAMRTFELQVKAAHRQGLKVFVIPSRIGGRLAGAPYMPSPWLAAHQSAQTPEEPRVACFDSSEFLSWSESFIRMITESFEIDGIIWDEPKGVNLISSHVETAARYGACPSASQMIQSALDYIALLTHTARKIRPELSMTIFNMPSSPAEFTAAAARLPGIDYAGFDGTCCLQSYFHETPRQNKPSIRQTWERAQREAGSHCGTFALIENILIPKGQLNAFEEELAFTLRDTCPDHLSCYYYGHNNEQAEEVQRITMAAVSQYKKLQPAAKKSKNKPDNKNVNVCNKHN